MFGVDWANQHVFVNDCQPRADRLVSLLFRAIVGFLVGLATWSISTTAGAAAEDHRRPNVLFLAIDDLNDWTQFLDGHPDTLTPHLNRLAERGLIFERAYCSAPACNPSRASLLCGVRPSTSGVYHNDQPWRPAMPEAATLPQHFMAHGYRAVGGGKIFHGAFKERASWHEYFERGGDPLPANRPLNGIPGAAHFDWGAVDAADEEMGDARVVHWASEFLQREHDAPFFLAVGLYRPHLPWYVPKQYFDRFDVQRVTLPEVPDGDLNDVPAAGVRMARPAGDHRKVTETDNWRRAVQGYLASIHFTDAMVGRLLDALDGSRYADNTIIVMWGDHGWHLGEKRHWRKFTLWEEATRVPLVIAAPGVTTAGTRCGRTVTLLDLYPTLCELCDLPLGEDLEGDSLLPLLTQPQAAWDRPAVTTHGRHNHTVRTERYRYIRYADGSEELYDHDHDPMEWTNLAGDEKLADVKQVLARWLPEVNAPDAQPRGRNRRARQPQ